MRLRPGSRDRSGSGSGSGSDSGEATEVSSREEDEFGPPFGKSLSSFYDKKKRIDAHEVKLKLQPETIKLYFEKLLADGKMDSDSAKKLHKKYFMSDKDKQVVCN